MEANNLYFLQPKQLEFANTFAKFRVFGGAKGGGKSYAMRAECARQCLSAPKIRGLALRRTLPEIEENMVNPMKNELPQDLYKHNAQKNTITFSNGSTLRFSYCRNLDDVLNFQGIEYDFICIEELTQWTEEEWKILMTSLRTTKKWVIPNFFGSTNPGWKWHAWVKRLWVDRKFKKEEWEDGKQYAFIQSFVWDNQVLMETQPEYVEALKALPDKKRRAYLEGDWNVFEGQYFPEFRDSLHIIQPHIPKDASRYIVCLDYGYAKPSAIYWLAQDSQGAVTCYRELYWPGMSYKEVAIRIKVLTTDKEKVDVVIVDPAIIGKRNESTGVTGKEEMEKEGLNIEGAKNARVDGWLTVRKYLQPFEDVNTKEITTVLKITSNCVNLIRTLPEQQHDKSNVEDMDTTGEDHACDALRYGLVKLWEPVANFASVRSMNEAFEKLAEKAIQKSTQFSQKPSMRDRDESDRFLTKKF